MPDGNEYLHIIERRFSVGNEPHVQKVKMDQFTVEI